MLDGTVSFALTTRDVNVAAKPARAARRRPASTSRSSSKMPVAAEALVAVTMAKLPSSPLGLAGLKVKRGKSAQATW